MGVLRIKDNVDELLEKDPYALFTLDEPHQIARRLRPEFWGAAFLGLLVAFGVALAAFLNVQKDVKDVGDTPFAYFEIKGIDPEGHPVAGAVVKDGDKNLGFTDSFGEWRRFMRVRLGSTVALTLQKRTPEGNLVATKNIAVPASLPASGDLELSGSVQLARSTLKGVPPAKESRRPSTAESVAFDAPVQGHAVVDSASPTLTKNQTSIWFMIDGTPHQGLTEVVQALRRRSLELGMRVDPQSSWRVHLTDMVVARKTDDRPERRLVVVDGREVKGDTDTRLFSYLRDYQDAPLKTARDILWAATMHMAAVQQVRVAPDGAMVLQATTPQLWTLTPGRVVVDAEGVSHVVGEGPQGLVLKSPISGCTGTCTVTTPGIAQQAPVAGWERLHMKMTGVPVEADVFVSGYEAKRVDNETFSYWGAKAIGANVTVVQGGRLIYRGRMQPEMGAKALAIPGRPISRARSTTL